MLSDIEVVLGDDITIDVEGISGKLHGGIMIHDEDGETTTATGNISITDGKYQTHGQQLIISDGQLIFTGGSIDNPGIRLTAYRTITVDPNRLDIYECRNLTSNPQLPRFFNISEFRINVGVRVTGRIDDQKISLFADPAAFTQADMLSLLVLGEPLCLIKQGQSQTLVTAISAMNMSGSRLTELQQQIAHAFGLDEITLTTMVSVPVSP